MCACLRLPLLTSWRPYMPDPGSHQREYVIHVCPKCGYYDADPILKRASGVRCFRCGQEAIAALDILRIAPAARGGRRERARQAAPVMNAIRVVPASEPVTYA